MKSLAFFRSISFGAFKPWKPRQTKIAVPTIAEKEAQLSGELSSILPITAHRPGSFATFHLLASHLTPQRLIFRTSQCLQEKDSLEIEVLIQGVGNITIMAQVQFVVLASKTRINTPRDHVESVLNPMYSGQLELWTTEPQQQMIRDFLRRSDVKQRSTVAQ